MQATAAACSWIDGEGVLVSFGSVASPEQKAKLRDSFGAQAVDMEAAAVARAAEVRGVEFAVVKVISDEFDFSFPSMERFVDSNGQFLEGRFAWFAALRPWLWPQVAAAGAEQQSCFAGPVRRAAKNECGVGSNSFWCSSPWKRSTADESLRCLVFLPCFVSRCQYSAQSSPPDDLCGKFSARFDSALPRKAFDAKLTPEECDVPRAHQRCAG